MATARYRNSIPICNINSFSGRNTADGDKVTVVPQYVFEMTVDTTLLFGTGSNSDQYASYFSGFGGFDLNWGDGVTQASPARGTIHTYPSAGVYTVRISGEFGMDGQTGQDIDRRKPTSVIRWGNTTLIRRGWEFYTNWNSAGGTMRFVKFENDTTLELTFSSCNALNQGFNDLPITSAQSFSMTSWFTSVPWVSADFSSWDVQNVKGIALKGSVVTYGISGWDTGSFTSFAVNNNLNFNEDLSAWDVSSLKSISFQGCEGFNGSLSGWTPSLTSIANCFNNCKSFNQSVDAWDVSGCTNFQGIFSASSGAKSPIYSGSLNSWDVSNGTTFQDFARFAIVFSGDISNWEIKTSGSVSLRDMMYSANSWDSEIGTKVINPGLPNEYVSWDVSQVNDFQNSFLSCSNFNNGGSDSIKYWNVSGALTMTGTFSNCGSFNQPINTITVPAGTVGNPASYVAWDMSNKTSLSGLLSGCTVFNQELTDWDVSSCVNLGNLFSGANAFNNAGVGGTGLGLDTWNVTLNQSLSGTFARTPFSHDLSSWNTSAVTTMASCFEDWSGSNNTLMSAWDTSGVNFFNRCFYSSILRGQNPDIGNWNTSSAKTFRQMFWRRNNFNRDLSLWNTSLVEDMFEMFRFASAFGPGQAGTVAGWSIASLLNAGDMFASANLSTANYDLILDSTTGWASQATIQNSVSFGVSSTQYTLGGNAEAGRNILTGTYGWTITDGGGV